MVDLNKMGLSRVGEGVGASYGASAAAGSPDDIAGLVLWLDASAEVGYNNGDSITTAQDQSGQNNDATETGSTGGADHVFYRTNIINSLPAYSFGEGGNARYVLPDFCSGFTSGEIFIVGIRSEDPPTSTDGGFWDFGTSGSPIAIPYSDGHIYDDWGSTARPDSGDPSTSMASPFVYGVWSANNDWANRLNGVTVHSEVSNTVGFNTAPTIGWDSTIGILIGKICEVIMYNTKLSAPNRQIINDYLEAKYGITMP